MRRWRRPQKLLSLEKQNRGMVRERECGYNRIEDVLCVLLIVIL